MRKEDERWRYKFQKYCQDMMRDLHGIPKDQLEFRASGRKRVKAMPPLVDITKRRIKRKVKE